MALGINLDDLFKNFNFRMPDLKMNELLYEYAQLADYIWATAPVLAHKYMKTAREAWYTYTETHLKRFESLSTDDQRKFMHSGLDGGVVFLLLTMIARLILTKSLEPYLYQYFHAAHSQGFSLSFNQAKWIFSASFLFAVWHANSHAFFNLGIPLDLSILLGVSGAVSYMIYRQSSSVKACFAFFAVPLLVLMPVSITVATMQHGPYITQAKMFPFLLAVVTIITSIYFIFEAPTTPVMKSGEQFGAALGQKIRDIWMGSWRQSTARLTDAIVHSPKTLGQTAVLAGTEALKKSGEKMTSFVNNQEEHGRTAISAVEPILHWLFVPVYHFLQGALLFIVGLIYRLNKFIYYIFQLFIDAVTNGLHKVLGLEEYLDQKDGHGLHGQSFMAVNLGGHVEEFGGHGLRRNQSPPNAAKLSRRVSRSRGEEQEEYFNNEPKERTRSRRNQ